MTRTIILTTVVLAALGDAAFAQPKEPVARGDFHASIGWLAMDAGSRGRYDGNQWENTFYGGVGAGWYWTDHLKTEIDFGAGTKAHAYLTREIVWDGRRAIQTSERSFRRTNVGISQQWQYFRNAWFHPHLAAGAELSWETSEEYFHPVYVFEGIQLSTLVLQPRSEPARTEMTVRPFVATGFKAYMTPRSFFRSDVRASFRHGLDEILVRLGFGVDF